MQRGFGLLAGAAVLTVFTATTPAQAGVAAEKGMLGIRILQSYKVVLEKYGAPNRVYRMGDQIAYIESVDSKGMSTGGIRGFADDPNAPAGGVPGAVGGGGGRLAGVGGTPGAGMGAMVPGGGMGAMMPGAGMSGRMGAMMSGGGMGGGMPSGAGGGPPAGFNYNNYVRSRGFNTGTAGGPPGAGMASGMAAMMRGAGGAPMMGAGGGAAGAGTGDSRGGNSFADAGGYVWVYFFAKKELAYEFHFNKDNRVEAIVQRGRYLGGPTQRRIALGMPVRSIYGAYGWPDATDQNGTGLLLSYNQKFHAQFGLLNNKVTSIAVFLREDQQVLSPSNTLAQAGGGGAGRLMGTGGGMPGAGRLMGTGGGFPGAGAMMGSGGGRGKRDGDE